MQNDRRNGNRVSALPYEEPPRRQPERREPQGERRDPQGEKRDPHGEKRDPYAAGAGQRTKLLKAHRTVIVVLLVVMILLNTIYAAFSSIYNMMTIVDNNQGGDHEITDEMLAQISGEMGSVSDSDFQMPAGTVMSDKDVEVILVVGCDARPNQTEAGRSDTMILAFVDRVNKKIKLISIMRDLWAPMSGVKGSNKINYAYYLDTAWGNKDIHITRNTIQDCFGIQIDHFVVIDIYGFVCFIEAIGEVEVDMTKEEVKYFTETKRWRQPRYKGSTEPGVYSLNGWESLWFVRMRHVGNGDFDRTRRQQYFLGRLLETIQEELSLPEMIDVFEVVLPYITTDLNEGQMLGYIAEAPNLMKFPIKSITMPVEGSYRMGWATVGSTNISVLLADFALCADIVKEFVYEDNMYYAEGGKATGAKIPWVETSSFTTTTEFAEPTGDSSDPTEPPPADTTAATTTTTTTAAAAVA